MYLQFIQKDMSMKLIDKKLTFDILKVSENRVDFKFKTYNEELQCGGWITEGYFLGNIDDISENLFELFDSVYFKKRSFDGIKIYAKTK